MRSIYIHSAAVLIAIVGAVAHAAEVPLSHAERKRLDTFEAHTLNQADKAFGTKKYELAAKSYDAFILQYPRSMALPYALLRKGRSLHLANKRFAAIKQYQEVLDYFPDATAYAAAAIYHQGEAHWQNADEQKALKKWATMALHKDWSRQHVAAAGLVKLADRRLKDGQVDQAVAYYQQIAQNFRAARERDTQHAVNHANGQVWYHYIRRAPDEAKLRAHYKAMGGHHHGRHRKLPADLSNDPHYWSLVRSSIWRHAQFNSTEADRRKRYFEYWARTLDGRFPQDDSYQIDLANVHRAATGDTAAWMKRLDDHFQKYQASDNQGRIIRWIGLYAKHKDKWTQYYNKLDFKQTTPDQVWDLTNKLFDLGDRKMAVNAFGKIDLAKVSDRTKGSWAHHMIRRDQALAERICASFKDSQQGRFTLLDIYHRHHRSIDKAIPLAEELRKEARFATRATWILAELYHRAKKYKEAIATYRQADNPPHNLKQIVNCYVRLGQTDKAIGQLREIEGFFKPDRAWAAYEISQLYRKAKKKPQYVAELRRIMKMYPGTGQASAAHNQLEDMGIRIGLGQKDN